MSASNDNLDPEAVKLAARIRRLMLISGATTVIAVGAVLAVIGYRLFTTEGSAPATAPDVSAALPNGARIVGTAVGEGRIVVTVETGAGFELYSFDLNTLKPAGRLKFSSGP